jgi:hypothetical protein
MNRSEGPKGTMGPTPFSRPDPPSSGRWKSTEDLRKGNDKLELEYPAVRLAREKRERIKSARSALLVLCVPRVGGPDVKLLTEVLGSILDELEAR